MAPMDRIELEGMTFTGRHGVRAAEREHPQEFTVDVDIESDLAGPASSDRIEDTVDYTQVRAVAQRVIEGKSAKLLETLAARIARGVLDLDGVSAVSVRVAKRPPSMMPILSAAVHIRRTRE
jgi:dihydroneopterin aldolase/2-amino-4-hydroxy-6-hydroxymethyldihydropteridine diphosphokinase